MNLAVAIFVGLFTLCALLPVVASALFGYRTGERVAISIGAISGLVLLLSCGFFAWLAHDFELSGEDKRLALFILFIPGVPALCTFLGTLVGYIAMGFLRNAKEQERRS
jgi:hypothetical protein